MTTLNGSSAEKLKVVFDTSVFIAAALRSNMSQELVERARDGSLVAYISEPILKEFANSLKKKSKFSPETLEKYIKELRTICQIVSPTTKLDHSVSRDINDNIILECALESKANLIITLDQDLIALKEFQGIGIVHPKTFRWISPKK